MAEFKSAQERRAPEIEAPAPPECPHCFSEPEPGWIETPNNGPIVSCPVCNPAGDIR